MVRRIYSFDDPDRFIAGAIGQPGSRTFFLQARQGERITSVVLEKVQVAVLAERLAHLLAEVRSRGANVPEQPTEEDIDRAPLDEPLQESFRVGTMAITWDGEDETIVIEARELLEDEEAGESEEAEAEAEAEDEDEEVEDEEADRIRVTLSPRRVLAFAARALEVVAAGRPPCPFCGQPLNPEGHLCVRRNGYMH
jgi:uncharacterized repeat protein (TIGR03847 family)